MIKLKCINVKDTLVSVMAFIIKYEAVRKIVILLIVYLVFLLAMYFLNFALFIQHPSQQGLSSLTILLGLYFVMVIILVLIMGVYIISKRREKKDIDMEKLEKLKLQVDDELEDLMKKKESE